MSAKLFVILEAPKILDKPRYGSPCNRCGECCRLTPCDHANVLMEQWSGACRALEYHRDGTTSCGLVAHPLEYASRERLELVTAALKISLPETVPVDASFGEAILLTLGEGFCDSIVRMAGSTDADIPYDADTHAIYKDRVAAWRQSDPTT